MGLPEGQWELETGHQGSNLAGRAMAWSRASHTAQLTDERQSFSVGFLSFQESISQKKKKHAIHWIVGWISLTPTHWTDDWHLPNKMHLVMVLSEKGGINTEKSISHVCNTRDMSNPRKRIIMKHWRLFEKKLSNKLES